MLVLLAAVVTGAVAQTTYKVSVKEGTEDATSWTIAPAEATATGVAAGTTVTATYSGTKKVKSVKAVKKAAPAAKATAEATAEDKGKLIGTDGKIYADVAAATAAGTTAVAKIIYIGTTGHATYNHGLALALTDESGSYMDWDNAKTACTNKNTSTPVTGATWLLASKDQWNYMLGTNGAGSYTALRDGFSGISGASNLRSDFYWSSTDYEDDADWACLFRFDEGWWTEYEKNDSESVLVRACLAF